MLKKRHTVLLLSLMTLCALLFGCCEEEDPVIPVQSVEVNSDGAVHQLALGETLKLSVTITPTDATADVITWTSSDPTIATVSDTGVVTALKPGEVTITVTVGGKSSSFTLTIYDPKAGFITLDITEKSLLVGDELTLTPTVSPETLKDKTITWTTSDDKVASVSDKGIVKALAPGECTITAALSNGETATAKVTVTNSFSISPTSLELLPGEEKTITVTDPKERSLTWESSDPSIATVDAKGKVTAVAPGKVTITASTDSGEKLSCEVTVKTPPLAIAKSTIEMNVGDATILKTTGGSGEPLEWVSSDPAVATVSATGKVTGKAAGKATITATDKKINQSVTCEVTIIADRAVRTIEVTPREMKIEVGYVHFYTLTVLPKNADNAELDIRSDNKEIAEPTTYKERPCIWGKKPGTTTIHFATKDKKHEATIKVTVTAPALESIVLNPASVTLKPGGTKQLSVVLDPEEALMPVLVWKSSDPAIVSVDDAGKITAVKNGKATITATVKGSTLSASCSVVVTDETIPDIPGHEL